MPTEDEAVQAWWGSDEDDRGEAWRPGTLEEFKGQPALSRELGIILASAKARHAMCDHLLFTGPPGLGKTTLAGIVAHALGVGLVATSGPAIEKPGEMAAILTGLRGRTVLFIDEIHRLPKACEEVLYTAMEDRRIDILVGEGQGARSIRLNLDEFVLVGATTQAGMLSAPLRDRFGFAARLRLYDEEALAGIISRSSRLLGFSAATLSHDAELEIARRSRGTPRIANKWLRRVRDYALLERCEVVDAKIALEALVAFGVDDLGLDALGRDILHALCENFGGGPVGLNTLAAAVGEAPGTIDEVYEPYLMARRLIARTPRGRVATAAAWTHLGLEAPARAQLEQVESLFDSSGEAPA